MMVDFYKSGILESGCQAWVASSPPIELVSAVGYAEGILWTVLTVEQTFVGQCGPEGTVDPDCRGRLARCPR